jgi:hypothetical protein
MPFVVHLHSGGVDDVTDCFPAPSMKNALSAMPLARGSHDYMGVQLTAVEECVEDLKERYPVAGVYVMGTSQGGTGAWLYAERHVLEIEGVSPWCGNADPGAWQGVWEDARDPPRSAAGGAWRLVRAARSPVARVEQLRASPGPPVYMGHGTRDTKIPIGHSESMYEKLGGPEGEKGGLRFERFEGFGHWLPARYDERLGWLAERSPSRATRFKKPHYRIPVVVPPLTFVADHAGAPPHRVLDPAKPARFVLSNNRDRLWEPENVEPWTGGGPSKLHYPGPACAVFESAFAVALPKNAPAHLVACADELAATWRRRYRADMRRSDAREGLSVFDPRAEGDVHPRTLVALGSPDENPAVRASLSGLDVRVDAGRARVFGREFEGDDIAIAMLRPNRDDPRSGTLVVWGSTGASYRQLWARFANNVDWEGDRGRWWFDYAVFDRKTCGPDTFLAVGFFDHEWRFDGTLLFEGSAELRAKVRGTHWPAAAPSRALSSVPPVAIDSPRGPVGFDRSAGVDTGTLSIQGKTFERGIGMLPPATVTWKLGARYAKLAVTVGLERTGGEFETRHGQERVRFEIWGDGERRAASGVLSATSGSRELEADLTGVETLELRAVPATRQVWHCGPVGWGGAGLAE